MGEDSFESRSVDHYHQPFLSQLGYLYPVDMDADVLQPSPGIGPHEIGILLCLTMDHDGHLGEHRRMARRQPRPTNRRDKSPQTDADSKHPMNLLKLWPAGLSIADWISWPSTVLDAAKQSPFCPDGCLVYDVFTRTGCLQSVWTVLQSPRYRSKVLRRASRSVVPFPVPYHEPLLSGLSNTAGVLAGVFGTYVTGHILQYGSWDQVWHVSVTLYIVGAVIWNLFATGERVLD